ncbi:ABC transporter substrate-binding protein [Parvibaculaceae bacterium PLY_AMNH_Bact1]|nr:ABC transporter substrate-binding protein [Parvibaculaceae bacterium PLY_AMNH_Bact1]
MRVFAIGALFLGIAGAFAPSFAGDVSTVPERAQIAPQTVILQFIEKVESARALETDELYRAQLAHLVPVVGDVFDMRAMSAAIVGRVVWRVWSENEKADFADIMTEFLAATIASRLELETNAPTEILATIEGPRGTKIVQTLSTQNGESIRVDYRLSQVNRGWAIVDIVADAKVSEVARRRAEFLGIIRSQGHAGIIAAIGKKLEQLDQAGT